MSACVITGPLTQSGTERSRAMFEHVWLQFVNIRKSLFEKKNVTIGKKKSERNALSKNTQQVTNLKRGSLPDYKQRSDSVPYVSVYKTVDHTIDSVRKP